MERRRRSSPDAQVHTWPAWRGSARAADQARPREDFTELHREHHSLAFPPAKLAELKHLSMLSSSASSSSEAPHRSARSRQIPRGKINPISSERRRPAILLGGAGRGRGVEHLAQGGGNSGHRSRPGKPGDGGGDPGRQSDRGGERRASGAGLGRLTDPDPSRVGLAVPEWAGWASWPVGPNGPWPIV
jgi:hypothetical protein